MPDSSPHSELFALVREGLESPEQDDYEAAVIALKSIEEQLEAGVAVVDLLLAQMSRGTPGVRDESWYAARDVAEKWLPARRSNPAKRRLTPEAEKQWREMVDPYLGSDPATSSRE